MIRLAAGRLLDEALPWICGAPKASDWRWWLFIWLPAAGPGQGAALTSLPLRLEK